MVWREALNAGALFLTLFAEGRPPVLVMPPPRVPPTKAEIEEVINKNKSQLTTCYERARSRDDTLVGGALVVKLSIGWGGNLHSLKIATPKSPLRVLAPCFETVMSRWVFPPSPRPYRTEFPLEFPSFCKMSIFSDPWSAVWVDGKDRRARTPFFDDHIACGEHTLTLRRADLQREKTESIDLRAGRRFEKHYTLTTAN